MAMHGGRIAPRAAYAGLFSTAPVYATKSRDTIFSGAVRIILKSYYP